MLLSSKPLQVSRLNSAGRCLKISRWALVPTYLVMLAAIYAAFLYAPTEMVMGDVQRIFYFHVSAAVVSFAVFIGVFLGGIGYLVTRNRFWDSLAASSVDVGLFLTAIVLTTGPIWSKPAWNVWLKWDDPRVLTELILLVICVAYVILRAAFPEGHKKYAVCAVFGIIGALDVPIIYMSVHWWNTFHPVVITMSEVKLDPMMQQAGLVALSAFLLLALVLLLQRISIRMHNMITKDLLKNLREQE